MASILDTCLKHNIALALTSCTTAIECDTHSCCLLCAIKIARETERLPLREGEGGLGADRYVMSLDIYEKQLDRIGIPRVK
jgi:hypothetical protein